MNIKKKAVTPVIMATLLIFIMVLFFLFASGWMTSFFSSYEIKLFSEKFNDHTIYTTHLNQSEIEINNKFGNAKINRISLNDVNCNIEYNLTKGTNKIGIESCPFSIISGNTYEILVLTDMGSIVNYRVAR